MRIEFLGAYGGNTNANNLTSFFVDGFLAIDAGALTQSLSFERQKTITDVLVSHSHLDHTLSLPFLADNLYGVLEKPLRIWGSQCVIDALRNHVFNEVTWPDFSVLPSADNPTVAFSTLAPEQTVQIGHLRVTPVPVNHVAPCTGFFVECTRTDACALYTADTCTTDRIWELANLRKNLKVVIVDCSFPNEMEDLAVISGHMTPKLLARDLAKLERDCEIFVYHIKPMHEEQMLAELAALNLPRLTVDLQGRAFEF